MAAWCTFVRHATRPPSNPSITQTSHSGRERSSGWATRRAISVDSSASPPGFGMAVLRMWKSMSKSGSSIHSGWCSPNGTSASRRRNGAARCSRDPYTSLTWSRVIGPSQVDGSSTITLATCMWDDGVSR